MTKLNRSLINWRKSALLLLICLTISCDEQKSDITIPSDDVVHLKQGWDEQLRTQIHHISFGSRLIPVNWLLNLESDSLGKLTTTENIEYLGFLPEPKSALNPYGLPVGFTLDTDDHETEWVGLGCTACHTGEVHYQGQRIRLEGGQSLVNFTLFEKTITDAMSATLSQPQKFVKFYTALGDQTISKEKLQTSMQDRLSYLKNRQAMNATDVEYGYGRLDAFGQIFNTVGVELLQIPTNKLVPNAPVSYPVLWNAPHLDLVQWNGSAPNADPGPLFQNITTAIAVYGQMEVVNNQEKLGYKSSVNIPNLKKIQNWLYQLKSPQWPEDILGKLDQSKLKVGEKIYQQECLQCHQLVPSGSKEYKLKAALTPAAEVGTDAQMVNNFLNARVDSGVLEGRKLLWFAGDKINKTESSINLVTHVAAGAGLNHPLQTLDAVIENYHPVYSAAINANPNYYKARPLTGIWASAPYLHNGSVLTLAELLSPVNERRTTFYVGDRNFDSEKVGLLSTSGKNRSLFDTQLLGNSNRGHLYGTELNQQHKSALLEYLKSL